MPNTGVAHPLENLVGWERAMVAFLVEKERRSGSRRTVEGYSRMLQDFFGRLGKTPDAITTQDVFVWAHAIGLSGKEPSAITNRCPHGLRLLLLPFPHAHGDRRPQSL